MKRNGNKKGIKVFSINTTIRSPLRNIRFLEAYQEFNGMKYDFVWKKYYKKIISLGIYTPKIIDDDTKEKIKNGEELSEEEVNKIIKENSKKKLGEKGRVGTQLRALKDQGFLKFLPTSTNYKYIYITGLGFDLLDKNKNIADVYCKAMIGMQANNPCRESMLNKSRPFLNTLHVIRQVTKTWNELGYDTKGITDYEFGAFVLPMNDCNYKKAANNIIHFRNKHGGKFNLKKKDFEELLQFVIDEYKVINVDNGNNKEIKNGIKTIRTEYPDEVFRKFKMTGLLDERRSGKNTFYYFNEYNIEKINLILETPKYKYPKVYSWKKIDDYQEYLDTKITLPWEQDLSTRIDLAKKKAKLLDSDLLNMFIEDEYDIDIKEIEDRLENLESKKNFEEALKTSEEDQLLNELLILSGDLKNKKSIYETIDEPLRLEYVLALIFGLKYGKDNVISNIKYDGTGLPLCHAPGGKPDIVFDNGKLSFIMEPTMLSNQTEMMKRESVGVWEHYGEQKKITTYLNYGLLISPRVFTRIACFFKFYAHDDQTNVIPVSIDFLVNVLKKSNDIDEFNKWLDKSLNGLNSLSPKEYAAKINNCLL